MTTTTTTLDLDDLQREMLVLLPPVDMSSLCCCCIIDPSLAPNEHLADCEIQILKPTHETLLTPATSASSSCGNQSSDHQGSEKRRKHRESMARLRRGWRMSIAALQQQEKELQALLRRMIVDTPATQCTAEACKDASSQPLDVLRRSYRDLVAEQVRLEQEQASLETARALKEKYNRLLERELVRLRIFSVSESLSA